MNEAMRVPPDMLNGALSKESDERVLFRAATIDDAEAIIPIVNAAYAYENEGENAFRPPDRMRLNDITFGQAIEEGVMIVATDPQTGVINGCVQYKEVQASEGSGSDQDINAYFGLLAVNPNLQRGGIGMRLLKAAEEIGRARGRNTMEIQVVNHSSHLLDVYGKRGYQEFRRVDWQANFLTKPSQFVLMSKPLNSTNA